MSLPPTPNHFTWERIDIGDLDQDLQHAEHGSDSPNDTPTPPPYSGYARVPPFQGQYQPGRAPDEHDKKDEGDGGDGFIKTALFPLPPTVAENHSHLSPYRYNTFPPPLGPPSTPNSDRETRPHGREQGYFETLDFSDYLPPANPGSANLQQHHLGEKLPSGIYSPRMMPLFESATMDSCTTWQREYVPRAWRDSTIETQARRLYGGYGAVGGRSLDVDCGRTAVGRFALGDKRRKWRAVREAVALVLVVLLVAGVLVVKARGGGKFVVGESRRGNGVESVDEWGPCTTARPRFCRLVVGAER